MEAVQEIRQTMDEGRQAEFEPEILAFCCEH